MHWVQFLLWTWLMSSLAIVLGLFWICKQSAKGLKEIPPASIPSHFPPRFEPSPKSTWQTPLPLPELPAYAERVALKAQSQMRPAS